MEKSAKRLGRDTYWMWTVPLVLGHVFLAYRLLFFPLTLGIASSLASADTILIVLLAIALARRVRDIGRPAWIGPTILFVTMYGLPFVIIGLDTMTRADVQIMQWVWLRMTMMIQLWSACGLFGTPVNIALLIVAGFMPGKPAPIEDAHVFD
jgi:uncharacterized membrane protein YhaH (DUF805 family)